MEIKIRKKLPASSTSIWFYCKWSTATLINLFSSVINENFPGKLSEDAIKSSSTKSYVSIVSFFVHWKSTFFLPTFKEFGVNSIYKYASTTRLKSKTFALQYLRQKSSKLSHKPLVGKLIFFEFSSPFLVVAIFLISGFYLTINNNNNNNNIFISYIKYTNITPPAN